MRNISIIAAVVLATILTAFAADRYFGPSEDISVEQVEAELIRHDEFGLYSLIREEFPDDYKPFLVEMSEGVSRAKTQGEATTFSFQTGRDFTAALRRKYASHIRHAPVEQLRQVNQLQLDLLKEASDTDTALCAEIARFGLMNLSPEQVYPELLKIAGATSTANFRAIAEGRDNPIAREDASDSDMRITLEDWGSGPDVTPAMYDSLTFKPKDDATYCNGNISFYEFLLAQEGDRAERVLATITELSISN